MASVPPWHTSFAFIRVHLRLNTVIKGSSEQVVMPSCQRKLASRIGLTADAFQDLDSGFRRNDDLIRGSLG
jgi:hypothetical protein